MGDVGNITSVNFTFLGHFSVYQCKADRAWGNEWVFSATNVSLFRFCNIQKIKCLVIIKPMKIAQGYIHREVSAHTELNEGSTVRVWWCMTTDKQCYM